MSGDSKISPGTSRKSPGAATSTQVTLVSLPVPLVFEEVILEAPSVPSTVIAL